MIRGDSPHFLKPLFFILNTKGKFNLCLFIYLSIYTTMMVNPRTVTLWIQMGLTSSERKIKCRSPSNGVVAGNTQIYFLPLGRVEAKEGERGSERGEM